MKRCGKCKLEKETSRFYRCKTSKDGLQWMCKACNSNRYAENPAPFLRWNKRRQDVFRQNLLAWLQEHPCVDCGEKDPVVLQFDHVRGEKMFEIARGLNRNYPWSRVFEEIQKCDVRCANCHVRKTAKTFGWFKLNKTVDIS